MNEFFCNLPSLAATLSYDFREGDSASRIVQSISNRISGIRLPPYELSERADFEVIANIEIDAHVKPDKIDVAFFGDVSSPRYRSELASFHWDFWKISIAALSVGLLRRGVVILHAACVASDDTIYLLPGASGAGKSSLAFLAKMRGATVYTSELAFVHHGSLIAGNSLMSIDEEALKIMRIPYPRDARVLEGKATVKTDILREPLRPLKVVFPRISASAPYLERSISSRRTRMLLFENAVGQLGISQLINQQRTPIRCIPTLGETETIMNEVNQLATSESLICEGDPHEVWDRLSKS